MKDSVEMLKLVQSLIKVPQRSDASQTIKGTRKARTIHLKHQLQHYARTEKVDLRRFEYPPWKYALEIPFNSSSCKTYESLRCITIYSK